MAPAGVPVRTEAMLLRQGIDIAQECALAKVLPPREHTGFEAGEGPLPIVRTPGRARRSPMEWEAGVGTNL